MTVAERRSTGDDAMSDIRGELRNASDAPPISPMPCFSGFGLPVCTQNTVDACMCVWVYVCVGVWVYVRVHVCVGG